MGSKTQKTVAENMVPISSLLPKATAARVRESAKKDNRTVSMWVRLLIERHFSEKNS